MAQLLVRFGLSSVQIKFELIEFGLGSGSGSFRLTSGSGQLRMKQVWLSLTSSHSHSDRFGYRSSQNPFRLWVGSG